MASTEELKSEHILHDLQQKGDLLLKLFELLPSQRQMDGLDILQKVVNAAVLKITKGRVKSISFVPIETDENGKEKVDGESGLSSLKHLTINFDKDIKTEPTEPVKVGTKIEQGSQNKLEDRNGIIRQNTKTKITKEMEEKTKLLKEAIVKTKKKKAKKDLKYSCDSCPYSTDHKSHLDIHLLAHTPSKNFECDECGKKFTAPSSLKRHKNAHEGLKPHQCPVCQKSFVDLASLRCHAVVHTGERLFQCTQCTKSYTHSANLSRHMRVHTGEMPYVCKECGVKFRDMSSLKLHNLKHTGEKPYLCSVCHKQFKTSSDFRRHERTHTGERNYTCELCNKSFIQGWHLKQHQRMHSDKRPFSCQECDKLFRTKAGMQHHIKVSHRGIKDHECTICQKKFSTKKYLLHHQVIHTQAKPYQCKVCLKEFNQIPNLKRHERIHSSDRRYKCSYCDKTFKYINSWRYHEGIHTGQMLTCDKCGIQFRSPGSMRKHNCDPKKYEENCLMAKKKKVAFRNGLKLKDKLKISKPICNSLLKKAAARVKGRRKNLGKVSLLQTPMTLESGGSPLNKDTIDNGELEILNVKSRKKLEKVTELTGFDLIQQIKTEPGIDILPILGQTAPVCNGDSMNGTAKIEGGVDNHNSEIKTEPNDILVENYPENAISGLTQFAVKKEVQ